MKQIRKMSNLVAEELQCALDEKGIVLDESAFEERVSDIVSAINEAVNEEQITEDDKFYMATKAGKLGGKDIAEGEYVELEDTEDGKKATIYDEDGNIKESDVPVDDDEAEAFTSDAEELEDGEDDDVDEGADCENCDEEDDEDVEESTEEDTDEEDVEEAKVHIKGGKKVKMTKSELRKKKAIAAGKKREGMKWDGKRFVKMTAQEKKRAKLWAKKMHKGTAAAHAKKSQKKAHKIAAGSTSGTVTEAFDIHSDSMTFTAEAGDVITMENGMISVVREGKTMIQGITVSEGFFDRCYEANVLEAVTEEVDESNEVNEGEAKADECGGAPKEGAEEEKKEEKTDEASILTFKADKGYVLVREGSELPMGNRVRARATLVSEGFNITSAQLDAASKGEMVTL